MAAVLGAGGAGKSMAAYLASRGYAVRLWNRPNEREEHEWLRPIQERGYLEVVNFGPPQAPIELATTDVAEALDGASVVAVLVDASLTHEAAAIAAPFLAPGQLVLLPTGGTGAAFEFRAVMERCGCRHPREVLVAELMSTLINGLSGDPGQVRIKGPKPRIALAALPATDTPRALEIALDLPFYAVRDVLTTSLAHFGITNHALPIILNAGWVEQKPAAFEIYMEGFSPGVSRAIEQVDHERLRLADALGAETISLREYLRTSVNAPEGDLYTAIHGTELYRSFPSPPVLDHRLLWGEVLTGIVPMLSLAEVVGCRLPLMEAALVFAEALLGRELRSQGRTVQRMGLTGLDAAGIRRVARGG